MVFSIFQILFNEGKRGNKRITMTLLHIRIKKRTNDIFIMQIVAYFFIFIERFTQSYEHNLALPVGKSQVNIYTSYLTPEERDRERKRNKSKTETNEKRMRLK